MRTPVWLVAAVAAVGAAGCGQPETIEPIVLRDEAPQPVRIDAPAPRDAMQTLDQTSPVMLAEGTRFFNAASSEQCPTIEVTTFQGETVKLQPGTAGYVTMVVFWSMDWPAARAAARHISDLQRTYDEHRVRAVGILLNTRNAPLAHKFAEGQRIRYPFYLDDLSALKEMAGKVGADDKQAMPAIFIVDRRLRLRFYRPGFVYALGAADPEAFTRPPLGRMDPTKKKLLEAVPAGQAIEDYLKMILGED